MEILKFKCTLKSDVIINIKSATVGSNKTLDFIPGSNFLGIVAGYCYDNKIDAKATHTIVHSGQVKFSDAHLADTNGRRSIKIPLSLYKKKNNDNDSKYKIFHFANDVSDFEQCRNEFITYDKNNAYKLDIAQYKSFAMKSAYDRNKRKSKDSAMFAYQSLNKGLEFYFYVETPSEYKTIILNALVGDPKRKELRHIGRSRTAQYGLVAISEYDFLLEQSNNTKITITVNNKEYSDCITVYAESRLIFLDKYGCLSFRPEPIDLGINDPKAKIIWDKTQIRTFQYAPWNNQRKAFDTERCGIEKGSVLVVQCSDTDFSSKSVGLYQNEGFGRIIYNPTILNSKGEKTALSFKTRSNNRIAYDNSNIAQEISNNELIDFLENKQKTEKDVSDILCKVAEFVTDEDRGQKFINSKYEFSSQWGGIRNIAFVSQSKEELLNRLFGNRASQIDGLLTHGVAQQKWQKVKGVEKLRDFINQFDDNYFKIRNAVINLASVMAQKCN